jgi:hypothetical protein
MGTGLGSGGFTKGGSGGTSIDGSTFGLGATVVPEGGVDGFWTVLSDVTRGDVALGKQAVATTLTVISTVAIVRYRRYLFRRVSCGEEAVSISFGMIAPPTKAEFGDSPVQLTRDHRCAEELHHSCKVPP